MVDSLNNTHVYLGNSDRCVMVEKKIDRAELETYLASCSSKARIFLGADSERVKIRGIWYADYISVIVIADRDDGGYARNHIMYQVHRDRDYDVRKDKPTTRLINEIYNLCGLYKEFEDLLYPYETELHIDINSVKNTGSNHVLTQAVGIVRGMCGIMPKCKPEAWAASFAADRAKQLHSDAITASRGFQEAA